MIYISAQPDSLYFIWQLEVQIFNFRRVGIADSQIHILIAHTGKLSEHSKVFKVKYPTIGIYFYKAVSLHYTSSVRPNVLAQHFARFPDLSAETIFYHDSDIIFRELPEIKEEFDCLVSDTRGYTGPRYVNEKGPDLHRGMAFLCDINVSQIKEENSEGLNIL